MSYLSAFSYYSRGSQGKNTEVVCHSLLQWTMFCQNFPADLTTVRAKLWDLNWNQSCHPPSPLHMGNWALMEKIPQMGDRVYADMFSSCFWCIFSVALGDSHCCFLVAQPEFTSLLCASSGHTHHTRSAGSCLQLHWWQHFLPSLQMTLCHKLLSLLLRAKGPSLLYTSLIFSDSIPVPLAISPGSSLSFTFLVGSHVPLWPPN